MGYGYTASYLEGEQPPSLPEGEPDIPANRPVQFPGNVWGIRDGQEEAAAQNTVALAQSDQQSRALATLLKQVPVAQAQKAVETAMRFQGMRGYSQDYASLKVAGLTDEAAATKALLQNGPRMFYSHPQSFAPTLRAMTPPAAVPTPHVIDLPGMGTAVQSGRYGERVQFPPATMTAQKHDLGGVIPVKDPAGGPDLGYVVATGPNTGRFEKAEDVGKLKPNQAVAALRAQSSVIQAQLGNSYSMPDKKERDTFTKTKLAELDEVNKNLTALLKVPKPAAAAPAQAPSERVRVTGPNGQRGTVPKGAKLPEGWKLVP